jgi:AcrR family transcriptional regulator
VPDRDPADDAAGPVIWTRVERAAGGPQPSLSYERLARAAVDIADAEGLEALSMRKVAARLGAGTMSLYRYVRSKDDLLELMVDDVYGAAVTAGPSGDWRADLARMARTVRQAGLRHPWLASYATSRPSFGPNLLKVIEHTLAAVDGTGLDIDGMLDIWLTVSAFVAGYVLAELAEREAQRRSKLTQDEWRARMAPYVLRLVESGRYPMLTRVVRDAENFPDPDEVFERRLGYVLDGLAATLSPDATLPADATRASGKGRSRRKATSAARSDSLPE